MREFTAISLFAGAGGLDMGFERAGFKTIWANDVNADACKTHENWSTAKVVCGDVAKVDAADIPDADIMLGGFPCQGFSLSGPRKIDDSRNVLYKHYVRIVKEKRPLMFVGENVKGLLTMGEGAIIDAIIEDFSQCGYDVYYQLMNARDYEVPEDRERVIIVGFRKDLNIHEFDFPVPRKYQITMREALNNIPAPKPDEVCNAPYSSRYMSRNRKRGWDEVSYTIPAMAKQVTLWSGSPDMIKLDKDLWKFGDEGITRRFSWREAAAIQTFPADLEFYGDLTSKYKQIGNAVPVKLAEIVARTYMEYCQTDFEMSKSGKQTETGKAFEFACAYVLFKKYSQYTEVALVESPQMTTARNAFMSLELFEREAYMRGAEAAVRIIDRLEPKLSSQNSPMAVSLQTDSAGIAGDVRDVLCLRGSEWEIGLSCKHNHEAVKHSRLSDTIDFGKDWFGKSCSDEYFTAVRKVFLPLRKIRDESKAQGDPAKWDVIADKEAECYIPILEAFMEELKRLDSVYPREIPGRLIKYLIGVNDFYKVIMNDQRKFTMIESVNINGALNQKDGKKKALIDVPLMKLPSRFYEIGFKDNSRNTIVVVCDQGWNVSMRIHNASSKIEPSLKFDVQLMAMPSSILTQIEPWTDITTDCEFYSDCMPSVEMVAEDKASYGD